MASTGHQHSTGAAQGDSGKQHKRASTVHSNPGPSILPDLVSKGHTQNFTNFARKDAGEGVAEAEKYKAQMEVKCEELNSVEKGEPKNRRKIQRLVNEILNMVGERQNINGKQKEVDALLLKAKSKKLSNEEITHLTNTNKKINEYEKAKKDATWILDTSTTSTENM